jgi:hypothetical protein
MDTAQWAQFARWMLDKKLLQKTPDPIAAITNEFLPGQGLANNGRTPEG